MSDFPLLWLFTSFTYTEFNRRYIIYAKSGIKILIIWFVLKWEKCYLSYVLEVNAFIPNVFSNLACLGATWEATMNRNLICVYETSIYANTFDKAVK